MAWNASGGERVRSYRLYRELEEAYRKVEKEKAELEAAIKAKDATIKALAAELAGMRTDEQPTVPLTTEVAAVVEAEQVRRTEIVPPRRQSGTMPAPNASLSELFSKTVKAARSG